MTSTRSFLITGNSADWRGLCGPLLRARLRDNARIGIVVNNVGVSAAGGFVPGRL